MDELNALPYLDAVVRETLRIHSPVPISVRMATRDDTIPVSKAWKVSIGLEFSKWIHRFLDKVETACVFMVAFIKDKKRRISYNSYPLHQPLKDAKGFK